MNVIGTCGNCGGAVCTPKVWFSVRPPTPKCNRCHATPREAHGPVIAMKPCEFPGQSPETKAYLRILESMENGKYSTPNRTWARQNCTWYND